MGEGEGEGKMLASRNVPASADLARSNSDSGSALTVAADVLLDSSHPDACAPPGPVAWTDEKHNSYIRSLEASFVGQLHRSINLCNSPLKIKCKPYSLDELPLKRHTSSRQIPVLRNGHWPKINKRNELPTESTADSHFVGETPEVSGSPVAAIHCEKEGNYLRQAFHYEETYEGNSAVYLARKLGKRPFGRNTRDSGGDPIGCSGQNFIDGGNVGEKSTSMAVAKRLKKTDSADSINDQVVPLGMPDTQDLRNVNQDVLARDRREQPEGLFVRHG